MGDVQEFKGLDELGIIELALEQIKDWVVLTDISGEILYANMAVEEISGYTKEELIGNKPSLLKSYTMPHEIYVQLWEDILEGKVYECVFANRHKNGNIYYVVNSIYPIKDKKEKIKYFISIGKDMKDEDKLTKQIHDTMHYDRLTGLRTRNSFIETISQIKEGSGDIAVLVIKIVKLGLINSKYGFVFGDYVIKEVGRRIREILHKDIILARVGGKSFSILLMNYKSPSKIIQLIDRIEEAFKEPMQIEDEKLYISLAYGISTQSIDKNNSIDAENLLTNAELALSKVKKRNTVEKYEFYIPSMNKEVNDRIKKEKQIYTAVKRDEFISYFQPIIDIETGKISSLEALMRQKSPTGEIMGPNHFINILEETGLMIEVGFNLIKKVCTQMRYWINNYGYSLPISINLSPMQFKDECFCNKILDAINEARIPPELITFEITESMLIEDMNRTISILEKMKARGFNVFIDDFGTGYSSLSYIQKLKIDCIKIDMTFIQNIVTNGGDQTIVKAIVMMAKGLNLKTVAEGIETKEQLDIIRKLGCDMGQGYYWNRPLSTADVQKNIL